MSLGWMYGLRVCLNHSAGRFMSQTAGWMSPAGAVSLAVTLGATILCSSAIAADVGAGFFVTRDGYFVTTHQVVTNAGSAPIVIRDKSGSQFSAVVVTTDAANDLALLKVKGSFAAIPIVKFSTVHIGDRVLMVAPSNDVSRRYGAGMIKASVKNLNGLRGEPNIFSVTVPRAVNAPGGPLLTVNGNVVGVITAQNRSKPAPEGSAETTAIAVKSDQLLALLATEKAVWAQLLPLNIPAPRTYGQMAKVIGRAVGMVLSAPGITSSQLLDNKDTLNNKDISTAGSAVLPLSTTIPLATSTSEKLSPVVPAATSGSAEEMFKNGHKALLNRDYPVAYQWLSQAAEQGNAKAQAAIGNMYLEGWGVDKDPLTASNWFRKAALQGDVLAGESLGVLFRDGLGVNQDDIEAVWWFQRSARQGSPSAQANMGLMYEDGRGVRQDDIEAVQWFRRAAELGNALAQYRLGIHYVEGRGIAKDDAEASKWLTQSARQGFAQAQDYLRASGILPPVVSKP